MIDDERKAANGKRRLERAMRRAQENADRRERAAIAVPHVGLAAYAAAPVTADAARVASVAALMVDSRWPWLPWWVTSAGVDPRDDRAAVRAGGKNGAAPVLDILRSGKAMTLRLDRAMGEDNHTSVSLDVDPRFAERGDPYELRVTCRTADLPAGASFEAWLALAHELVVAVGAMHATLGAWPTYAMARADTDRVRVVLDTPAGELDLGLPADVRGQLDAVSADLRRVGRVVARHPRWGTYLHAEHVARIGGVPAIRDAVAPARIEAVEALTYIQLTESIDSALTAAAGERRRALEALMAPILVSASTCTAGGS